MFSEIEQEEITREFLSKIEEKEIMSLMTFWIIMNQTKMIVMVLWLKNGWNKKVMHIVGW